MGESVEDEGKAAYVRYMDFGNAEVAPMARLHEAEASVFAEKPLVERCELAFVQVQALDEEFGTASAIRLNDLVWGKSVEGTVTGREDGKVSVVLFAPEANPEDDKSEDEDAEGSEEGDKEEEDGEDAKPTGGKSKSSKGGAKKEKAVSVNELLVMEGLGKVPKRLYAKGTNKAVVDKLRKAQEVAHEQHLNMWRYGDIEDDDAEEFGNNGRR